MPARIMSQESILRSIVLSLLVTFASILPSQAVTYLKTSATGAGDGTSWMDACTNVAEAVTKATAGDKVIHAAGGIYIFSATIEPADGLSLFGGFPGLSTDETLGDRDADTYQTIFTGDQALDDTWVHVEPIFGEYRFDQTVTSERVLTNGLVNLPGPFSGDYDGFWANIIGPNTTRAFTIASGVGVIMDGLWFTGFHGSSVAATCIEIASGAKSSSIIDCRFVGTYMHHGNICDRANTVDTFITRCQFLFNRTMQRGSGFVSRGRTIASDCTFVSCSRSLNNGGNVIYFWTGSDINTKNSTFTRCLELSAVESTEMAYGGSGNIVASEGGTGSFTGCVFTNNLSMSPFTYGSPVFAIRDGVMSGCLIANNRYEVKPRAGRSYALFGNTQSAINTLIEGCTFTNNTISAPEVEATSGSYALGILGHGNNYARYSVINCTFADNDALAVTVEGVAPVLSRALLSTAAFYGSTPQMGVANCTFTGPIANGLYDIVQYGPYHMNPLTVLNSIFTRDGETNDPFYVVTPEQFMVRDCVVKNMYYPPTWLDGDGIEPDEPALASLAVLIPGTVPVQQVTVRMPGIRQTADVATNQATTLPPYFRYRLRDSSTWVPLVPAANGSLDKSTPLPIPDACGNARAFGSYTRGAVQPLTMAAESGVALVLRRAPPSGGTFSAPGNAQTVATNAAIEPVTAIPVAGASFLGWYDENDDLYSADATLTIASLAEDTLLTAKFGTANVTLTFELGSAGLFTANNSSTITVTASADSAFPSVPETIVDPGWLIESWSPAFPPQTPWTNATYTARSVSTALRILHVVPPSEVPESSDGSGLSWVNASGDLATAYADAGRYRGEVWLKQGRYVLTDVICLLPNVAVRGGFEGMETDASQADPANRLSIISGDINDDTYWRPNGTDPGVAFRTNIWTGCTFNRPNPSGTDDYWSPIGNVGDDMAVGFADAFGSVTNAVLDGVVVTCFREYGVKIVDNGSHLAFSRCKFYACNSTDDWRGGDKMSAVDCAGSLTLETSEFIGNWRALNLSGSAVIMTNVVRECLFEENMASKYSAGIHVTSTTPLLVEKSRFYRNVGTTESLRCSGSITLYSGSGRAWIDACRFEENRVRGGSYGHVIIVGNGPSEISRCAFVRNNLVTSTAKAHQSAGIMVMAGDTLVRDSMFEANTCVTAPSSTSAHARSSAYCGSGGNTTFLNVTFRNNSATVTEPGTSSCGTFALTGIAPNLALVNCTVDGSVLDSRSREFVNTGGNANTTIALVNSVVRNVAVGYVPFDVPAAVTLSLADSSISGIDTNTLTTGSNGYLYNVSAVDALLRSRPVTIADGVRALGVSSSSPFVNAGRPVWLAPDGYLYLYDSVANLAKPWRQIVNKVGAYATVAGLDLDSEIVPDAQGEPRFAGRIAYGPLAVPVAPTIFLIR